MEMNDVVTVLRHEFKWTKDRLDKLADVPMEEFTNAFERYERYYSRFYNNFHFVRQIAGLAKEELEKMLEVDLKDIEFC